MAKTKTRATPDETAVRCALGRLFRLGSRPFQEGDLEQYEACRQVILACAAPAEPTWAPSWARDRSKGAAGD